MSARFIIGNQKIIPDPRLEIEICDFNIENFMKNKQKNQKIKKTDLT